MDNKSSKKYKRYLEPNCDTQDRKVPRRTKYRQRLKRCKSANRLTTPTTSGEATCSDSNDAIQDISILTEVSFCFLMNLMRLLVLLNYSIDQKIIR